MPLSTVFQWRSVLLVEQIEVTRENQSCRKSGLAQILTSCDDVSRRLPTVREYLSILLWSIYLAVCIELKRQQKRFLIEIRQKQVLDIIFLSVFIYNCVMACI
jgi:hypothetical protein